VKKSYAVAHKDFSLSTAASDPLLRCCYSLARKYQELTKKPAVALKLLRLGWAKPDSVAYSLENSLAFSPRLRLLFASPPACGYCLLLPPLAAIACFSPRLRGDERGVTFHLTLHRGMMINQKFFFSCQSQSIDNENLTTPRYAQN